MLSSMAADALSAHTHRKVNLAKWPSRLISGQKPSNLTLTSLQP